MRLTLSKKRTIAGYAFISPFLLGVLLFFGYSVIMSIVFSMNKITVGVGGYKLQFVGFDYYYNALFVHAWFNRSFVNSLIDLINVPLIIVFSFFAANILKQKFKGRFFARAIFFLPVILAAGIVMKLDNMDLVNQTVLHGSSQTGTAADQAIKAIDIKRFLFSIGFATNIITYISNGVARIYQIITDSGVQILVFLAALQSIPKSLFEASDIEGATAWENFWKITFPIMTPYMLTNIVYSVIDNFTSYKNQVMLAIMYTAQQGEMDYSYSTAMAVLYFVAVAIILAVTMGILSKTVYYND